MEKVFDNILFQKPYVPYCVVFILWYTFVFLGIDSKPIEIWDEARYALNGIDMLQHGNPFLVSVDCMSDWWNTKPPFAVWCIALSFKIFGVSEFAVRFPSAFSALLLGFACVLFCKKLLQNTYWGVIPVLILYSLPSYNGLHIVRSGDVDALLVLAVLSYSILYFYMFINKLFHSTKYLLLLGLLFTVAFYIKSVAGLIAIPGIFIHLLITKKIKDALSFKSITILFLATFFVFLYYLIREQYDPGYFHEVFIGSDIKMHIKERGSLDFFYYVNNLIEGRLGIYIYILPLSFIVFFSKNKMLRSTLLYFWVLVITMLLIISSSTFKKEWYDAPIIPVLVLIVAFNLYVIYDLLFSLKRNWLNKGIFWTAIIIIFYNYTYSSLKNNFEKNNRETFTEYSYDLNSEGATMRYLAVNRPDIKSFKFLPLKNEERLDPALFYINMFDETHNILLIDSTHAFTGDTVLVRKSHKYLADSTKIDSILHENRFMYLMRLK